MLIANRNVTEDINLTILPSPEVDVLEDVEVCEKIKSCISIDLVEPFNVPYQHLLRVVIISPNPIGEGTQFSTVDWGDGDGDIIYDEVGNQVSSVFPEYFI